LKQVTRVLIRVTGGFIQPIRSNKLIHSGTPAFESNLHYSESHTSEVITFFATAGSVSECTNLKITIIKTPEDPKSV